MINKYVVFIGLCSYNLFNFGSDYSDFLKKNKLILSEDQKIVFHKFVDDWRWFLQIKPDFNYNSCPESDQEKLAFLFVNRNYNQFVINGLYREQVLSQQACASREEKMKRQYGENINVGDDWYYNCSKIQTDALRDNIEELTGENRKLWPAILAITRKDK